VGVYFLLLPAGSLVQPGKRAREDEGRRQRKRKSEREKDLQALWACLTLLAAM